MRRIAIGLFIAGCLALALIPVAYAEGLFAGGHAPATPRTYPSGSGLCSTTLQACVSGSVDHDLITILPGTYITDELIITHSLTLQGSGSPTTTLKADGNHRVVQVLTPLHAGVVISNMRVMSGNLALGAGVYAPAGESLTLMNMDVVSNSSLTQGGGIYATGLLTLTNVNVTHNRAGSGDGGGLYSDHPVQISGGQFFSNTAGQNGGAMRVNGPLTLTNVLIISNTATAKQGGGVRAASGVVIFLGGLFDNKAGSDGGGLYALGNVSIFDAEIRRNSAANIGGGMLVSGSVALTLSAVTGNSANVSGGGMYVTGTASDFVGLMAINTSTVRGGAIFVSGTLGLNGTLLNRNQTGFSGGGADVSGTLSVTNVQVVSNTAFVGAGIAVAGNGVVTGSLFRGNTAFEQGGGLMGTVLDVADTDFIANQALILGGAGMFVSNSLRLRGGLLQDNMASQCSGVQARSLNVQATQFIHNQSGFGGGGACATGGSADLSGALFQANSATSGGGGLIAVGPSLRLTDTQFISNSTVVQGGGLFAIGTVTLTRGLFERNTVSTIFGLGGGLSVSGTVFADGTRFLTNTARTGGGAFLTGTLNLTNVALFSGNRAIGSGGGVDADRISAVNSVFISNTAGVTTAFAAGGGVRADIAALTGTQFIRNYAVSRGGGGSINSLTASNLQVLANATGGDGAGFITGFARVDGSVFMSNTAGLIFSGYGGGVYAGGTLSVFNSQFISNTADSGGGFGAYSLVGGHLQLIDNHAAGRGGGAAVEVLSGSTINLTDSVFLRNSAFDGGALYYHGNSDIFGGQIVNSLFAQNSASSATGAAEILQQNPGPLAIVHDTFAGRSVNPRAALVNLTGTLGITDSIIVSHSIGISVSGGTVNEDFNLYFANPVGTAGPLFVGGHSLTGDPRFVNPAADNYHLGPTSAAIDHGGNAGIALDFDGDTRPFGAGFDIGYDEATWRALFLPAIMR